MRFTLQVFGLFVGLVFGPLLAMYAWVRIARPSASVAFPLLFLVIFLSLAVCFLAITRHIKRRGPSWQELGLCKGKRSLAHLLWQVPLALLIPALAQMTVSTALDPNAEPADSSLESAAASGLLPAWALFLGLFSFIILAPILEEIVFRGVLMHELGTHVRPVLVIVISAVLFMAIHLAVPVFPFLFVSGLILGWLRLWHGNLWAPMTAHICGNAVASFGAVLALT